MSRMGRVQTPANGSFGSKAAMPLMAGMGGKWTPRLAANLALCHTPNHAIVISNLELLDTVLVRTRRDGWNVLLTSIPSVGR